MSIGLANYKPYASSCQTEKHGCDHVQRKCSGKGCANHGSMPLRIIYIGKTGYFCTSCSEELLDKGLAVRDDIN